MCVSIDGHLRASTGDRCARRHDMERAVHHVCVEGNRPEVLEPRRLVEIDGIPRLIDVDDLAIGAGSERHPGTSLERHLILEPFACKINGPELVMTNLLAPERGRSERTRCASGRD